MKKLQAVGGSCEESFTNWELYEQNLRNKPPAPRNNGITAGICRTAGFKRERSRFCSLDVPSKGVKPQLALVAPCLT